MTQTADIFTFRVDETIRQLQGSLEAVAWAASLLPDHLLSRPPQPPAMFGGDAWSAAMNLAHLAIYEERIAVPVLASLAAGGDGTDGLISFGEDRFYAESVALSSDVPERIMARLRAARQQQVELAATFASDRFNAPLTPGWRGVAGTPLKSPGWVLGKTVQHTWEHGNSLMRIALFASR